MSRRADMGMRATGVKTTSAVEKLKAAEGLCADLNTALREAGITLPSLCVEPCGYADANPRPLIQLGRCNVETARALLAVARTAAQAQVGT